MNFENVEAGHLMKVNDINWILEEQIGKGGNGVVWSASRESSKAEKIAIKFVNCGSKNKNKWKRFEREVTTQSSFEHQSIISIYDYDKSGSSCWLSMPICNPASRLLNNKNATEICDE